MNERLDVDRCASIFIAQLEVLLVFLLIWNITLLI